jgi:hypothetical protein
MGAEPWSYYVPYQEDLDAALDELKQREFSAGRYRNPLEPDGAPGTIEEAIELCEADGTGSILDMLGVQETPHEPGAEVPHFSYVAPLSREQLIQYFGAEHPTHSKIASCYDFFDDIERGEGIYVIVYENNRPNEIFFAGYSYD